MTGANRRDSIDAYAAVAMVLLTLTWGLNQVAIKISNEGYNPVFLTIARSAIGATLVWLWCQWRGIRLLDRDETLLPGLVAGALFGLEFVLIFIGMDYTTAARGALMINTMPFWILIGAHFILGEKMNLRKLGGLILAFFGVVLVFSDQISMPNPSAVYGDILILIAAFLWASTTLVIRSTTLADTRPEKTLLYQLFVAALIAIPLLPIGGPIIRSAGFLPTVSLLFQGVFVVAVTYLFWFRLVQVYPASGLSSFTFLTPVFGVLLGGLLLSEPISIKIIIALVMIAAGLVIVNRTPTVKATDPR